ncbi:MAG: RimK family alpha-L-glutamate ligase [Planctomycetota bacterium]
MNKILTDALITPLTGQEARRDMQILILSRKPNYYSTKRLVAEAKLLKHKATVLDPTTVAIPIDIHNSSLITHTYDSVIPRIGTYALEYTLSLLEHLRGQGSRIVNSPESIALAKNKFLCLQRLAQAELPVPPTVMVRNAKDVDRAISQLGGLPVIIKLLKGGQGAGVMLGIKPSVIKSILRSVWAQDYDAMLQKYIVDNDAKCHSDIRVLVVGNKIIGAIRRYPKKGEFRANIHCGGKAENYELSNKYRLLALTAVESTGLDIAGVDLIESADGPMILEVNTSPGFEGLEKASGVNVAQAIIELAVRKKS